MRARDFIRGLIFSLWALPAVAADYHFVTLDFPPLEFSNEKNETTGAAVEVVRTVMEKLGHHLTIEVLPWSRSFKEVTTGKADAIFTAYRSPEREHLIDYSSEVLVDQFVALYIKTGSPMKFTGDLHELNGHTVGVTSTISYGEEFDKAVKQQWFKADRVEELELNFKKLVAGRVDYVVSNSFSAAIVLKQLQLGAQVQELPQPVTITHSYVGFAKGKYLQLRDDFDRTLKDLKRSGEYNKILKKWSINPASNP